MTNEDELRKRYMQSRGMSAVGGAAKGASAGTAIMPGVGSAIGAGLGGIAGWISGGPSEAERLRDEQLAELMRLEEFNALGIGPRAEALARSQAQGAGNIREMRLNQMAERGITDTSGSAKDFMALMDAEGERLARTEQNIMQANLQKEQQQRDEIARMQNQQLKEQQQDREDMMNDIEAAMSNPAMMPELEALFAEEVGTTEKQAAGVSEVDAATIATLIKLAGQYGLLI